MREPLTAREEIPLLFLSWLMSAIKSASRPELVVTPQGPEPLVLPGTWVGGLTRVEVGVKVGVVVSVGVEVLVSVMVGEKVVV